MKQPRSAVILIRSKEEGAQRCADPVLSTREAQVLGLLCHGLTDKEVSLKLGVSRATIRVYRERIQKKLQTTGLLQSALVAWRLGLLDLETIADEALRCSGRRCATA